MKIDAKSKEEYFAKVGDRAQDLRQVDELIKKYAPDVPPAPDNGIFYGMISYGLMLYKTKAAKEESEWPLFMLAAQKNHLAFYVCAVDFDGKYIAEKYEKNLGNVSCGKSCIRFKKFEDLNQAALIEMLTDLNDRFKAGEKLYGA